jgi:hypothetical protein
MLGSAREGIAMGRINVGRVVLCGIIAVIVIDLIAGLANTLLLGAWWNAAARSMNQPPLGLTQITLFKVWGLVIGFAAAWIYAGFRPRFGASHRTAIIAGLTTWFLASVCASFSAAIVGYPIGLMIAVSVIGFFAIMIGSLIGNYFYQEA